MTTLTAVYEALVTAKVPQDQARRAVEAIEESRKEIRDEPWKQRIEARLSRLGERVVRLEVMCGIIIALLVPMFIKTFWG